MRGRKGTRMKSGQPHRGPRAVVAAARPMSGAASSYHCRCSVLYSLRRILQRKPASDRGLKARLAVLIKRW